MKALKLFAVAISLFGFCFLALGLWMLLNVSDLRAITRDVDGLMRPEDPRVSSIIFYLQLYGTCFVLLGGLSLTSGFGILQLKMWARKLWLTISILVAVLYNLWLWNHRESVIAATGFIEYFLIASLVIASWLYLNKASVINLFRRHSNSTP